MSFVRLLNNIISTVGVELFASNNSILHSPHHLRLKQVIPPVKRTSNIFKLHGNIDQYKL